MVVCFHCSQETKQLLDSILQTGGYKDYGELIATAISNLSILQGEVARTGAIVIGNNPETGVLPAAAARANEPVITPPVVATPAPPAPAAVPARKPARAQATASTPRTPAAMVVAPSAQGIPERLVRNGLTKPSAAPASFPDDVWAPGATVPLDRWVFGQYNKLLPAKVSCRALAHLLVKEPRGVVLDSAVQLIAEDARSFGRLLREYDSEHSTDRDTALAVAFPSGEEEKSLTRYANQFVASINKFGQISGLLVDLKLINFVKTKEVRLVLTSIGWQLAILKNPVIDGFPPGTPEKFSAEEAKLLLGHIRSAVPAEDFAYQTIIDGIRHGAVSPDQMDAHLTQYVATDRQETLSKSFLASQRSGAVSRMVDLGLLRRCREGVKVSYELTNQGAQYRDSK
jgi:hypothetical protein